MVLSGAQMAWLSIASVSNSSAGWIRADSLSSGCSLARRSARTYHDLQRVASNRARTMLIALAFLFLLMETPARRCSVK